MAPAYIAHRSEDGRTESVSRHLNQTAKLAGNFAEAFGAGEDGRLAGMAHDLGKYSEAFQRRIDGDKRKVDHSTAGAYECFMKKHLPAALAVAGHHGGLPDFGNAKNDGPDDPTLAGRIKRAESGALEPYGQWKKEISLPEASAPGFSAFPELMFYTRMLYSCLVDADYLSTDAFMAGCRRETDSPSVAELAWRLDRFIQGWYPPKTELNDARCEILTACRRQGKEKEPGLFTLTVPTGGGKTVASLAFALAQAKTHGMRRIIYVIPYTSIIRQNASVFRKILGSEAVLEHHSGVVYDLKQEADPETIRLSRATENWDMPVIVTTAVQFFESLFASRSSKCRKLHNIAGSVIIFDEAQMMPISYLRPCVYAIAQLVQHYRVSAVLCTATQPALGPLFREFITPDTEATELCPAELFRSPVFRRVTFQKAGQVDYGQLAERLNGHSQVLCVVNSRESAGKIYKSLTGEGRYHLSALMYPAHREKVIDEILRRLREGLPCRAVSTSLIEAGVDVDFPAVYREACGLDSVLQSAGRCNREGRRPASESFVTIFRLDVDPPKLFSAAIGAGREIIEKYEDISCKEAVAAYYKELLELKGQDAQDQKGIMDLMNEKRLPFREIAENFHLIEASKTVYIPLESGAELADRLRKGERSLELFRELGIYGVSVYDRQFDAMKERGVLELFEDLEDGPAILSDISLYSSETGLNQDIGESEPIMMQANGERE